jgi:hypothetical protein
MKNLIIISVIFLSVIFLQACVSNYTGPKPNLDLKGQAAQEEFDKFKIYRPTFFGDGRYVVRLGENQDEVTTESVRPIIYEVSPVAKEKLEKADHIAAIGWIPLIAAITMIPRVNNWSTEEYQLYYGLLLTSFGINVYSFGVHRDAIDDYNVDLKLKLNF